MSKPILWIVIPCYNEALNIPLIVARLREITVGRSDVEVLLVDNGSRDDSAAVLQRELQGDSVVRAVTVPVNTPWSKRRATSASTLCTPAISSNTPHPARLARISMRRRP